MVMWPDLGEVDLGMIETACRELLPMPHSEPEGTYEQ